MPAPLLWICQVAVAVVFGWAAVAKVVQWRSWRSSLIAYGIPRAGEATAAVLVPLAELGVVALVVSGLMNVAMAFALGLLALFSFAVLAARARSGDRLPCGCFGKAEARDYRLMLVRNALLSALAATVLLAGDGETVVSGADLGARDEILPALLVAGGVLLGVWMLRHATQLMRRREHM